MNVGTVSDAMHASETLPALDRHPDVELTRSADKPFATPEAKYTFFLPE